MVKMRGEGWKIVLTAERCMMSDYHGSLFLGFCACAPKKLWNSFAFFHFICPKAPTYDNGKSKLAPYATRKIEASLLEYGFTEDEVVVVEPESIRDYVGPKTKVIGVTSNDPLGRGPATTTFSAPTGFFRDKGEAYDAWKFRELVTDPYLKHWGAKIVVGGPGSWQLEDDKERRRLNVDVVVIGEGENVTPPLFEKIVKGEKVPEVVYGDIVETEKMSKIRGGTVGGVVEVSRGCGRGCKFCIPTLLKLRSRPLEDILEEVRVNVQAQQTQITLHAEDILRYKANGIKVNREAVTSLFESVKKIEGVENVGPSHFALASVASQPKLLREISDIVGVGGREKPWIAGQTGVETGSPKLIERHMPGKALPFKPKEWPDVVEQAFGICMDSDWVPCGTLILGLPGEEEEDILKTIELMDRLKNYKSLIVPLFFVPIGSLKKEKRFTVDDMKEYHWDLMLKCWDHGMRWAEELAKEYVVKMPFLAKTFVLSFITWVVKFADKRARKNIVKLKEKSLKH